MSALPPGVVEEAIHWAVRLDFNTPSARTRQAFERWLDAEPAHAAAWERVQSLKNDFQAMPPRLALDALQAAEGQRHAQGRGLNRRQTLRLLALAGVSAGAAWTAREHAPWQRLLADVSTGTGEQRSLRLDDGTLLRLNTDSALGIKLHGERRVIVLRRGEILITTGDDAGSARKRPFWVQTPAGGLHALGTRFVVRLLPGGARVSVQEGAVEMHPAAGGPTTIAHAGDSGWLDTHSTRLTPSPVYEADGWADGVITGQNMRLAELLDELARYRVGRIVCDPRVADLRVSGTYHVGDTDQALRFLVQTQPVRAVYRTRFWVAVEADPAR